MTRPRLLDLFCGAGGASAGYVAAGFDVEGVDLRDQPRYPYMHHRSDALEWLTNADLSQFQAIHASPPCQAFSPLSALPHAGRRNPPVDLVEPTRRALIATGLPYVMENVVQAGLNHASDLFGGHGVELCGTMFGLKIFRHRHFETSFPVLGRNHRPHRHLAMRAGYLPTDERPFMSIHGRGGHNSKAWVQTAAEYMGTPWMAGDLDAVCEAIPPAYTQHIGEQLLALVTT